MLEQDKNLLKSIRKLLLILSRLSVQLQLETQLPVRQKPWCNLQSPPCLCFNPFSVDWL